ncbi:MAG: hypothetical protein ACRECY_11520 [Phyllobacterium sp.]
MRIVNSFIAKTIRWFLIVSGLMTCAILPLAIDINFMTSLFGGLVDYTPSSVPALRHWGFTIFGIGALMVVSAFRPWLRFEVMLLSSIEKAFLVYLVVSNHGQPWMAGYLTASIVDGIIATYSLVYFLSDQGRPGRWVSSTGRR